MLLRHWSAIGIVDIYWCVAVVANGNAVALKRAGITVFSDTKFLAVGAASAVQTPVSSNVGDTYGRSSEHLPGQPSQINGSAYPEKPVYRSGESWVSLLEAEATAMLAEGQSEVIDKLGRCFESVVIKAALRHTHGRKNDAAIRLGIGRNTITRKIQELGIDGVKDE